MKRIITCIIMMVTFATAFAQTYSVLHVSGQCGVMSEGEWSDLQPGASLNAESVLRYSGDTEASIHVCVPGGKDIYMLTLKNGYFSFRDFINADKTSTGRGGTSSFFWQLAQTVKSSSALPTRNIQRTNIARTSRSTRTLDENSLLIAKKAVGKHFSGFQYCYADSSEIQVCATIYDSNIYFVNGSSEIVYITLLSVNKDIYGEDAVSAVYQGAISYANPSTCYVFSLEGYETSGVIVVASKDAVIPENLAEAFNLTRGNSLPEEPTADVFCRYLPVSIVR